MHIILQYWYQCCLYDCVDELCTDYSRLREVCATCHLHGAEVRVHRVAASRTIQVHNIGDMSEDLLSLYFENKRSGGSEVTHVRMCQEDNYALVEVTDSASELQHLYVNALDVSTVDVSPAQTVTLFLSSFARFNHSDLLFGDSLQKKQR